MVAVVMAFVSFRKRHNIEVFSVDSILLALIDEFPLKKQTTYRHIPVFSVMIHLFRVLESIKFDLLCSTVLSHQTYKSHYALHEIIYSIMKIT